MTPYQVILKDGGFFKGSQSLAVWQNSVNTNQDKEVSYLAPVMMSATFYTDWYNGLLH
ncbi:hypothetical protein NFHSH190041_29630 [Shewanella sp. NFH-SH190041]|nr:hypothetical protein NFHSH190041_29630 [Shewanella sp. NFH-SH190041]